MIHLDRSLISAPPSFEARLLALYHKMQIAIEIEHATIPVYLYSLYSIREGFNIEIAARILSVIKQEMLHMSLDCNILNAIGGAPKIDDPNFIPHYPGPLPGAIEGGLQVSLSPLSKQLVYDEFMVIESPETPLDGDASDAEGITIGQFYRHLHDEIIALNKEQNIFTGKPELQLQTGFPALQIAPVTDEASALAAIEMIVAQGEGTSMSPLDPEHELAHYYKFAEIYYGRALVPNPDLAAATKTPWVFAGHPIAFDPAGVHPVISNPSLVSYDEQPRLLEIGRAHV